MAETVTVKVDESGRVTIPKATRKLLDIEGSEAIVRLDIEVRKTQDND